MNYIFSKVKILIGLAIMPLILLGCIGTSPVNKSLVNDLGSPDKVRLLEKRVTEFWNTMVKHDLEKAYEYYDPFMRARMNVHEFINKHGLVKYDSFTIEDIKVEGNVGTVRLSVTYHIPKIKVFKREFSQPKTTRSFEERWLYVYDNWYKEYYLRVLDTGIAFY